MLYLDPSILACFMHVNTTDHFATDFRNCRSTAKKALTGRCCAVFVVVNSQVRPIKLAFGSTLI